MSALQSVTLLPNPIWGVLKMIICVCNNISEREIQQAVALGVSTMEQLRDDLGVATCCGKCFACAKHVLNESVLADASAGRLLQPTISAS
jgi:bacterioferritin-associated ferredoxin